MEFLNAIGGYAIGLLGAGLARHSSPASAPQRVPASPVKQAQASSRRIPANPVRQ